MRKENYKKRILVKNVPNYCNDGHRVKERDE